MGGEGRHGGMDDQCTRPGASATAGDGDTHDPVRPKGSAKGTGAVKGTGILSRLPSRRRRSRAKMVPAPLGVPITWLPTRVEVRAGGRKTCRMSRLRFNLEEAEAEATRLATAFVQGVPELAAMELWRARPDRMAPRSSATKIPVMWVVLLEPNLPPGVVMDGGQVVLVRRLGCGVAWRRGAGSLFGIGDRGGGGKAEEDFVGAAAPGGGEDFGGEVGGEEGDGVAGAVGRVEFDEGGLHADFEEAGGAGVDEAGAGAEAVLVAGEDQPVAGGDEAGVAGGGGGVAGLVEGGSDGEGAGVKSDAGAGGVQVGAGLIEEGAGGGVELEVVPPCRSHQLLDVFEAGGVGHGFAEVAGLYDRVDLVGGGGEALHAGVDGEDGMSPLGRRRGPRSRRRGGRGEGGSRRGYSRKGFEGEGGLAGGGELVGERPRRGRGCRSPRRRGGRPARATRAAPRP